jgi:hypothetical protein
MPFSLLPSPWTILAAIIACTTAYLYGHHAGFAQRDQQAKIETARQNEQARAREQTLTDQVTQAATTLQEANNATAKKQSDLVRINYAGGLRLPTLGSVPTGAVAAPAAGNSSEANAQPGGQANTNANAAERQAIDEIIQIAADGDRAINQLNACIDAYNAARKTEAE